MKIAMIGTGNVGQALASTLIRNGHQVTLAGRDAGKTQNVAASLGARSAAYPAQAAADADVIVLAVPYDALLEVGGAIADEAAGKVVIDVTNPGPATEGGASAAERLAGTLEGAYVAKAFNTLFGSLMADPSALGTTIDSLFATDSEQARTVLFELIDSIGLRPVDVGPLSSARQMEAMAWLNIQLQLRTGGDWTSTFVLLHAPAATLHRPALAMAA